MSNTYEPGQCTWEAQQECPWLPHLYANAGYWLTAAAAFPSLAIIHTPRIGAIAVWRPNTGGAGALGHVAVVHAMATMVTVSESNWNDDLRYGTRVLTAAQLAAVAGYIVPTAVNVSPAVIVDDASQQVNDLYWGELHRGADAQGLAYFVDMYHKAGAGTIGSLAVQAALRGSAEYHSIQAVTGLYWGELHRAPDGAGMNYWLSVHMEKGSGPDADTFVRTAFRQSAEYAVVHHV